MEVDIYKFSLYRVEEQDIGCSKEPKPRSGHRIVCSDGWLYCFGGYNPAIRQDDVEMSEDPLWKESCPLFRELWKYNIATKRWSKVHCRGVVPHEVASHAAVILGKKSLFVYGGSGMPFGENASNVLHVCNIDNQCWNDVKTTGIPPEEQYGQAVALYDDTLYVCGGTTGFEYSNNIHSISLSELNWNHLTADVEPDQIYPHPRYRHEIVVYDGKVYVFGGGTADRVFSLRCVPVFDISTSEWMKVKTTGDLRVGQINLYPKPRRCHSLVRIENDVYVCGGYNGEEIFGDIWRFNLEALQWTQLPVSLKTPTYFHSAAVDGTGRMFVYGGVTAVDGKVRTSTVTAVWLQITSLSEMCWEALCHYLQPIDKMNQCQLIEAGVPRYLTSRVGYKPQYG